jgi:3-methyl-2-oxobutanoate hydroxymethyltransferase
LVQSAVALEQAGAQLLVLELVPEPLAKLITERLRIPTIGIDAGRFCDGRVLIVNVVLRITPFQLRFAKQYQHYHDQTLQAIEQYQREVEHGDFPSEANVFGMEEHTFAEVAVGARTV